ncbi:ribonuclease P [Candidatus Woesearchaeota archaeon]|nr:ribonuclease P [Candidatus Woesearchaeota archaeon]
MKEQKASARAKIVALFEQAASSPRTAKKNVALARKLSSKFKVRIPLPWKRRYCRGCNAFFVPGKNCRIRTRDKRLVMSCLECGYVRRLPVKR